MLGVTTVSGQPDAREDDRERDPRTRPVGRDDIPVAAGADRPLVRERDVAAEVHGETGLDGPDLPPPARPPEPAHAIDWIAKTLRASPSPVTLVPTGPLTNIALLLARYPELEPHRADRADGRRDRRGQRRRRRPSSTSGPTPRRRTACSRADST